MLRLVRQQRVALERLRIAFLVLILSSCCAVRGAGAEEDLLLYDFESGSQRWRGADRPPSAAPNCQTSSIVSKSGDQSLAIACSFPGVTAVRAKPRLARRNWHRFTHLSLDIYVPGQAPAKTQVIVYLKDTELNYYQHFRRNYLPREKWFRLCLDLTATSSDWQVAGHFKPWDGYCRADVQQVGVKFVSEQSYNGPVYMDDIRLTRNESCLPERNEIHNLRINSEVVKCYGKFEISFNLARTYDNPFDPDQVDVRAHFITPSGKKVCVPGFFYQGYRRSAHRGAEVLTPMGRTQWKIRFAPRKPGAYHYYVEIRDGELVRSEMDTFRCVEGTSPGFVRISARDPAYYEFDSGEFYYPIGHNIAAVHDARARVLGVSVPASEGTYAYDRYLRRMGESGENFGRVWMTPWSFEIEWTKAYDVHFRGLGRYNMLNAWRLDHVLDAAEEHGVRLMLLISSHGEVGDHESDFYAHRMQGSPYWSRYGGPLSHPKEFYTSQEALKYYKRLTRYIVARWAHSTGVFAWEILNEPDLAHFYNGSQEYGRLAAEFVRKLAEHIRRHDHAEHLITSGCYWFQRPHAAPTMALKELDFNTGHIFGAQIEHLLRSNLSEMTRRFGKIFLATEAGLTPFAQDPYETASAIHRTLWSSHMMPYAGAAATWWWVLVDKKDYYHYFKALSAFAAGEDRRDKDYRNMRAAAQDSSGARNLRILALGNEREAICWIYEPVALAAVGDQKARDTGAEVRIHGLEPAAYGVEVWNTYTGEIIGTLQAAADQNGLAFVTPPFERDIACKVRRR